MQVESKDLTLQRRKSKVVAFGIPSNISSTKGSGEEKEGATKNHQIGCKRKYRLSDLSFDMRRSMQ
jgi:hypothetical protein